jgi:hypothetical protein
MLSTTNYTNIHEWERGKRERGDEDAVNYGWREWARMRREGVLKF